MKFNSFILISTIAILVIVGLSNNVVNGESAYFAFKTHGSEHDMIFKLNDNEKIKTARKILDGSETETTHVFGRIIKRSQPYNPHYSFHLDENQISFFQMAIEVCDATTPYVEEHLDEACGAFLPGCMWCPWSSKLTREVKSSEIDDFIAEKDIHISIQNY